MTMITRRLVISGRVQGVGYRAWARDTARQLGLTGWVRNEPTGHVTALIHGPAAAVEEMHKACRTGPQAARPGEIQAGPAEPPDQDGFAILRQPAGA